MEYIPGHTLRDLIRKEAPMSPAKALALLDPVLSALAAAHQAGMIHRDVKPENVLLADDGRVKVADFGLARAVSAETQHTATGGVLIGTVSYLSPELVVDGRADARSDVYAAGVVLYEMLTGRKPHEGDSPIQVAYKHVHEDVPPPSRVVRRHPGVRRRARRPRHRPGPRPAPGRRAGAAAPGAPGPRRARPRRARRPRADRRPDPDRAGAAARGLDDIDYVRDEPPRTAGVPTILTPGAGRAPGRTGDRRHQRLRGPAAARAAARPAGPAPAAGPGRPRRSRRGPAAAGPGAAARGAARASAAGGSARAATSPPPASIEPDRRAAAEPRSRRPGWRSEVGGRAYSETVAAGSRGQHRPRRRRERHSATARSTVTLSRGPERHDVPRAARA